MKYDKEIEQKIRERAYEIYEWRIANNEQGSQWDDWFEAEQEMLKIQNGISSSEK